MISSCYASGPVSGSIFLGGLMAINNGTVINCYATGSVTPRSGSQYSGGLVYSSSGSYEKCFWDSDVNPDMNGIGDGTDPNVIGESTTNMQTKSTFTDAGWDFSTPIWKICDGTNYPKLARQKPALGDFVCPDGVDFIDYAFFARHWLETDTDDVNGVDVSGDEKVNQVDFALLGKYWMMTGCGNCGGADLTGDGNVNWADIAKLSERWLWARYGDCGGAEITGDGVVNELDLAVLAENWLEGVNN